MPNQSFVCFLKGSLKVCFPRTRCPLHYLHSQESGAPSSHVSITSQDSHTNQARQHPASLQDSHLAPRRQLHILFFSPFSSTCLCLCNTRGCGLHVPPTPSPAPVLGSKSRASQLLGKCCTTEPHPWLLLFLLNCSSGTTLCLSALTVIKLQADHLASSGEAMFLFQQVPPLSVFPWSDTLRIKTFLTKEKLHAPVAGTTALTLSAPCHSHCHSILDSVQRI
jgi:hypothetical protein